MIKRLGDESGYSLVEVMASIIILAVAIIPMVAMFDIGLRTATAGSNYDKARVLAKKQQEQAQSLSYGTVKTSFPAAAPCTFTASGLCESSNLQDPEFSTFRYTVRKQFVQLNPAGTTFVNTASDRGMMRITVLIRWGGASLDENEYTTAGLKVR